MVQVELTNDTILKYNKTLLYNENVLVLKIAKDEKSSSEEPNYNLIGILENGIVNFQITIKKDSNLVFETPSEIQEIKDIYQIYLFVIHEYSLRPDTLTKDEKLIIDLLRGRVSIYSNTIRQMDLLSQIKL